MTEGQGRPGEGARNAADRDLIEIEEERQSASLQRDDEHQDVVQRINERHDRVERSQRWYDRLKLTLLGLTAVLVTVILVVTLVTLQELRENSAANRRNTTLLVDCTTPKGKCYQESVKRSAVAVQDINKVSVLAAYCAKRLPTTATLDQMTKCITDELGKDR